MVIQDGGLALTFLSWPPDGFLVASQARSQVNMLLQAWGFQHCGHEQKSELPQKEIQPLVTWVSLGETRVVEGGFTMLLGISTGAVTGSVAQVVPVVAVGNHN